MNNNFVIKTTYTMIAIVSSAAALLAIESIYLTINKDKNNKKSLAINLSSVAHFDSIVDSTVAYHLNIHPDDKRYNYARYVNNHLLYINTHRNSYDIKHFVEFNDSWSMALLTGAVLPDKQLFDIDWHLEEFDDLLEIFSHSPENGD